MGGVWSEGRRKKVNAFHGHKLNQQKFHLKMRKNFPWRLSELPRELWDFPLGDIPTPAGFVPVSGLQVTLPGQGG